VKNLRHGEAGYDIAFSLTKNAKSTPETSEAGRVISDHALFFPLFLGAESCALKMPWLGWAMLLDRWQIDGGYLFE